MVGVVEVNEKILYLVLQTFVAMAQLRPRNYATKYNLNAIKKISDSQLHRRCAIH